MKRVERKKCLDVIHGYPSCMNVGISRKRMCANCNFNTCHDLDTEYITWLNKEHEKEIIKARIDEVNKIACRFEIVCDGNRTGWVLQEAQHRINQLTQQLKELEVVK